MDDGKLNGFGKQRKAGSKLEPGLARGIQKRGTLGDFIATYDTDLKGPKEHSETREHGKATR